MDLAQKPFRGGVWDGNDRIVVGIDIGTTHSGVAFAYLENGIGVERTFQRVTHWPGQGSADLQSKIPSLVWYDPDKKAVSFGAEAATPDAECDAEDNKWQLAKHFKLHLHPDELKVKYGLELCKLPTGISLLQVYSDFLGYLLQHTQKYFEERVLQGGAIWAKHRSSMDFVIAHPNGWRVTEQSFLRAAAIKAGLATRNTAQSRITFVTEAEASVHFCLYHTSIEGHLQVGKHFAVCDAGGSTVDTTVYSVESARPDLKLKEARASACVQAGAIFVDAQVERHLRNSLKNPGIHKDDVLEYTQRGVKDFEKNAKRSFRDPTEKKTIDIASTRVNIPAVRTSRGRMELPGALVKSFFDFSVDKIKASVGQQTEGRPILYIFLVGGFGESPYLQEQFKHWYKNQGCEVILPNHSTSKAVADGAVIWKIATSVVGRAPRVSFGVGIAVNYDPTNAEHQGRKKHIHGDGVAKVYGRWNQIAQKVVVDTVLPFELQLTDKLQDVAFDAEAVVRQSYYRTYTTSRPNLERFEVKITSYSNDGNPGWILDEQDRCLPGFNDACVITADLRNLSGALQQNTDLRGMKYWGLEFDVCIRLGGTELEAYIEWEEKAKFSFTNQALLCISHGVTRNGPAVIITENDFGGRTQRRARRELHVR